MFLAPIILFLATPAVIADTSINVLDFGAKGDAATDDTKAFQAALDRADAKGQVVHVPAGEYRIDGTLTVPPGVTLEGVWAGPHTAQLSKGTTLLAYTGRDNEDATPFINLQAGATLKGITVYYPEQTIEDPRPYPWTIQGRGQHYNVIDVTIVNAWNGVDCGTLHNEGHHLRNVFLCALRRGVLIDQCTDVGRVENVHIHSVYWWRANPPGTEYKEQASHLTGEQINALNRYTAENLEGFIIGRTDWEYMSGCFVIWAKVGFRFLHTKTRVGGKPNVVITQSGSDIGPLAVLVESAQDHAGVAFENCQFMSGFEIRPENRGPVKLSNCGFWGKAAAGSQMILKGQGTVTLTAVHFNEWDPEKPCVVVENGSLLARGCDFMAKGTPILLEKDVISAAVIGNRFRGGEVVNESEGEVQMVGNVGR